MGTQKKKGNRGELYFANELNKRFKQNNFFFRRVPSSGAHGTNLADTNIRQDSKEILSGDIICPPNFKFCLEVKTRVNFNFWDLLNRGFKNDIDEWLEQVEKEAEVSKKEPMLFIKVNNRKPFVLFPEKLFTGEVKYKNYTILRFDHLLELPDEFFIVKI